LSGGPSLAALRTHRPSSRRWQGTRSCLYLSTTLVRLLLPLILSRLIPFRLRVYTDDTRFSNTTVTVRDFRFLPFPCTLMPLTASDGCLRAPGTSTSTGDGYEWYPGSGREERRVFDGQALVVRRCDGSPCCRCRCWGSSVLVIRSTRSGCIHVLIRCAHREQEELDSGGKDEESRSEMSS
jgi:hypothetical protein